MCMGKAIAKPQIVKREDPSIKFVDGNNILDPKASPPEIDNTPVIKEKKKVKNNVTSQSSNLNINTTDLLTKGNNYVYGKTTKTTNTRNN